MNDIKKFIVMGDPIQHSLSPRIHSLFARQFDLDLEYTKLLTTKQDLVNHLNKFKLSGGTGINLTSPLKEEAIKYVDHLSPRAKYAKSINTIYIRDNKLFGDNTDGIGFIRSLKNIIALKDKNLLILGAGGALKGIFLHIIQEQVARIHVANRTVAKASFFAKQYSNITVSCYAQIPKIKFDVVINTTSILKNCFEVFELLDISADFFFDLQYSNDSAFLKWCLDRKKERYTSGLSMLIEQAAEGFYLWHGVKPKTDIVFNKLIQDENEK